VLTARESSAFPILIVFQMFMCHPASHPGVLNARGVEMASQPRLERIFTFVDAGSVFANITLVFGWTSDGA